jgi:hypothetical protein
MGTYIPLQSITLAADTSAVTISGIDQTYQDLVLVMNISQNTTNTRHVACQLGGTTLDTGSNYSETYFDANGSVAVSSYESNKTQIPLYYSPIIAPGTFSTSTTHFFQYSNTNVYKSILTQNATGSLYVSNYASLWRNTSAISQIYIYPDQGGTFQAGSTFDLYGISPVDAKVAQASGGTGIYYDSSYVYHVFTGSGTFTPNRALTADILVVGGGAGGGGAANVAGGGGGAGGFYLSTGNSLSAGTSQTILVGSGGAGTNGYTGNNGGNSSFGSISGTIYGGGGGSNATGANGGSGGGGAGGGSGGGGTGTAGQGNNGGSGAEGAGSTYFSGGGGGGGAYSAGGTGTTTQGGAGGTGAGGTSWSNYTVIDAMGAATGFGDYESSHYYFAGGGGGATGNNTSSTTYPPGTGGYGGGGIGATQSANGNDGMTNTGGGGGGTNGGTGAHRGYNGGSGIVIVRYPR